VVQALAGELLPLQFLRRKDIKAETIPIRVAIAVPAVVARVKRDRPLRVLTLAEMVATA